MGLRAPISVLLAIFAGLAGCEGERDEDEPDPQELDTSARGLIDCSERQDTGYTSGNPFAITVVTVDGKPVERDTANAYDVMQQAAAADGVSMAVVSGFRTMAQQEYLYGCYVNCNCNNCNLAARPGYSNHQSGHALDLNTSAPGVLDWLNAHGANYGFMRTVPSEAWHWEWWGGGPGGGPCGQCMPHCEGPMIVGQDCGRGDCSVFGARCVDDALGLRCASVFCPDTGAADVCLDAITLGHCSDGALSAVPCPDGQGCHATRCEPPPQPPATPVGVIDIPVDEPSAGEVVPQPPAETVTEPAGFEAREPLQGGCGCAVGGARAGGVIEGALLAMLVLVCRRRRSR